jgi:hypothetical protein
VGQGERFSINKLLRTVALTALLATVPAYFPQEELGQLENPVWIIGEDDLSKFINTNPHLAERLFDSPSTFVVDTDRAVLPENWGANIALPFASYSEFEELINAGIDPQINAVIYDNEGWDKTPLEEQKNITEYTKKFAELAHENGLLFINSPHSSLAKAHGSRKMGLEANWGFYLNTIRNAAQYADILVVQLQWAVSDRAAYNDLLIEAKEAALEGAARNDKSLLILGEVSTNPEIPGATAKNLLPVVNESLTEVNGMWLLLNYRDRGVGFNLLRLMRTLRLPQSKT